jgi:hypothetical protein
LGANFGEGVALEYAAFVAFAYRYPEGGELRVVALLIAKLEGLNASPYHLLEASGPTVGHLFFGEADDVIGQVDVAHGFEQLV